MCWEMSLFRITDHGELDSNAIKSGVRSSMESSVRALVRPHVIEQFRPGVAPHRWVAGSAVCRSPLRVYIQHLLRPPVNADHPLTPPEVNPAMNQRWNAVNTASTGINATITNAEKRPQKLPNPVVM